MISHGLKPKIQMDLDRVLIDLERCSSLSQLGSELELLRNNLFSFGGLKLDVLY